VGSVLEGDRGEIQACGFLRKRGYLILFRNFRSKFGEIDIIAKDGKELVFVEVKKRRVSKFGSSVEAVTRRKIDKILKTIDYFFLIHKSFKNNRYRFDVIGLDGEKLTHIKNALA
jgi:putative endonuclease